MGLGLAALWIAATVSDGTMRRTALFVAALAAFAMAREDIRSLRSGDYNKSTGPFFLQINAATSVFVGGALIVLALWGPND